MIVPDEVIAAVQRRASGRGDAWAEEREAAIKACVMKHVPDLLVEVQRLRAAIVAHQIARYAAHEAANIVDGHTEDDRVLWRAAEK